MADVAAAPVGRPTKYDPARTADLAYKFCLLGATDEELARNFEVDVSTISKWKNDFPEFSEALKNGKVEADAMIAKSLFHRAKGYEHEAVKIFADPKTGMTTQVDYIEHYPPDTGAAIFWLKNRQKDKWRDKYEHDTDLKSSDGSMSPKEPANQSQLDEIMATLKSKTADAAG